LRNDSPSGFSKVVNQGIKYAQENEFSFVSIFNNDLIMKNNWVQPVFEAILQHPSIGMVGGTFYNSQIEVDGVVENCNNLFNTEFNLWEKGGPWTFRTEVFDNIGLFDEGYTPSWFEDDDILVRMALGNYIFGRVENAVGLHYDGVTRLDEVEKEYGKEFYTNSYNRFCEKWGIEQGDRPFIVYDKVFTEKRIAYIPIAPGKPIIIEDENIKYGKDFSDGTSNLRP
jgi:GT2 family glycosyltransferase